MHIPRPLTLLTLLGLLLGGLLVATPRPAAAQGAACFAETGFCVQGRFLASWQQNGGLAQFGFPLSEEMPEILPEGRNSPAYVVQYLERARFEYHDEFAGTPSEVLLGQFERRILAENDTPRGNPDIFALYITDQARRERLGAPLGAPPAPPARVQAVTQAFERDRMLFLPNPYLVPTPLGTPPAATIVAFCGDRAGVYYPAPDTWAEG